MAYRHLRRLWRIFVEEIPAEQLPPKSNMLLMGPTGCGKTFLVELLFRRVLELPTVVIDVTNFSETGYVGQDTSTIVTRLLHEASDDIALAQVGIICLDEFDKLASGQNSATFAGGGTTKDVSGRGVQRELLKMLEDVEISVPLEISSSSYSDRFTISTRDIAFIACGAFSGFRQIAEQRSGDATIGFGRESGGARNDDIAVSLTQDQVDDLSALQTYGFMPELIGRFARVVPFEALDEHTLGSIVWGNYLPRYLREFDSEGCELRVEESYVAHLVKRAIKRQTGARGLASELQMTLERVAYDVFGSGRSHVLRVEAKNGEVITRVDGRLVAHAGSR